MFAFLIFKVCLVAGVLALTLFELYRTRKDLARMRAKRAASEAANVVRIPGPTEGAADAGKPSQVANG